MISLAFSIFLDMKISGVTLFGGMVVKVWTVIMNHMKESHSNAQLITLAAKTSLQISFVHDQ